jgi:hypothetical protein
MNVVSGQATSINVILTFKSQKKLSASSIPVFVGGYEPTSKSESCDKRAAVNNKYHGGR